MILTNLIYFMGQEVRKLSEYILEQSKYRIISSFLTI